MLYITVLNTYIAFQRIPLTCVIVKSEAQGPCIGTGLSIVNLQGSTSLKISSLDWNTTATNRTHSNYLKACWMPCCYFCFIPKSNFDMFYVFFDLVILPYLSAFSIDFYAVKCLILSNCHVCEWKSAYIKDINAVRILMILKCIYLGVGSWRGALIHVYV